MIIRREALQAVLPATMKQDPTHRLDKVQITHKGEVVATDGHLLLIASEATRFPDEDFPSKDVPAYHGDPKEAVTIDRPLVERLLKGTTQSKRPTIPILAAVQLGQNSDGAYAAATDLEAPTVIRLKPQSEQVGGFPTWERIVPAADKPALQLTIGADLLVALAKAAGYISEKLETGGKVTFYIPTAPENQGVDAEAARVAGAKKASAAEYPNGKIESAIRVEIDGREVQIVGVIAPIRRAK